MEVEASKLHRSVKRFWFIPIMGAIVFGVLALVAPQVLPRSYTATTSLLVVGPGGSSTSVVPGVGALMDMARSRPVMEQVINDLELDTTFLKLRKDVVAVQQLGTSYLLLSVENRDPEQAVEINNAVTNAVIARADEMTLNELTQRRLDLEYQVSSIENQIITLNAQIDLADASSESGSEQYHQQLEVQRIQLDQQRADLQAQLRSIRLQISSYSSILSVVEPARVPDRPNGVSAAVRLIIGGFVGGVLGTAVILVMALKDHTIVNADQVMRITGRPVLREIEPGEIGSGMQFVQCIIDAAGDHTVAPSNAVCIVAPTEIGVLGSVMPPENQKGNHLFFANGAADNLHILSVALESTGAILAVQIGVTTEDHLRKTVEYLAFAGIPMLFGIVIGKK